MGFGQVSNRMFSDDVVKNYKSDYRREEPIKKRCPTCKYKIGGPNHENGNEHIQGKKK